MVNCDPQGEIPVKGAAAAKVRNLWSLRPFRGSV